MTQPAKRYYRVMLGRQSVHAAACFAGGFIGADYEIRQDLSNELPDEWWQFAVRFIGLGASRWIMPAAGSWIVTRCDLRSAQAGQVSGKDLLVWHKRGVRIFNLQALHAKVFAFNGAAFIGSSNASVTSRDRLIEAGVYPNSSLVPVA